MPKDCIALVPNDCIALVPNDCIALVPMVGTKAIQYRIMLFQHRFGAYDNMASLITMYIYIS